jgi:hypothetical protein
MEKEVLTLTEKQKERLRFLLTVDGEAYYLNTYIKTLSEVEGFLIQCFEMEPGEADIVHHLSCIEYLRLILVDLLPE